MGSLACCTVAGNTDGYEIRTKRYNDQHFQVMKTQERYKKKPIENQTQVLKVKKSQYQELIQLYQKGNHLWEDPQFQHNAHSIGNIQGVKTKQWKRLSHIIPNPVLFDGKIQPQDAIQGSLGDCYFLSAISAIAEKQERIKAIFGVQQGTKNSIYRVLLRINGIIEEIVVDDYVPVNSNGQPVFCQPNKNEIWVPILQKAWAKANGSYANIVAGSPSQIFRAMMYSPAETLETGDSPQEIDTLWNKILHNAKLNRPCCCGTDDSFDIDWERLHLVPGHAYTLIDAAQLQTYPGDKVRMLKLRNPWANTEWEGEGCEKDSKFWKSVVDNQTKSSFLRGLSVNNDGIFYIRFRDYLKYFVQTHICHLQEHGNYIYEEFQPSPKRGVHWGMTIFQEGEYWLELHQNKARSEDIDESNLARLTIFLARNRDKTGFESVGGVLGHYRPDCSFKVRLEPGQYTIFTKIDANQQQKLPNNASISVYSLHYAYLQRANLLKSKPMLQQCMLNHARMTKKNKYQNETLWISWKLMYKEGGYAYICFGAEKGAQSKWSVQFNQSDFEATHFKLKKPYKRKGDGQKITVLPGEEKIIVVRIKNDTPTQLKWPPKLSYKILPLN